MIIIQSYLWEEVNADLNGAIKYGHRDMRNVLERSSARETTVRVAAGAVAKKVLAELGITVAGHEPFTACPPNSLRSAAMTLAPNESAWRERNRASSDSVMTGAGTSRSIDRKSVV